MGRSEHDIEKLLSGGISSDPSHKAALKRRLFDENVLLSADDLNGVSGGVMENVPVFEDWPDDHCLKNSATNSSAG